MKHEARIVVLESHDHNFKNLFLDFPKEAIEWFVPAIIEEFGTIRDIEFIRQEPGKRNLSDRHLALDMPILFTFELGRVLLWLVEFQEDKAKFSIFKLLRYLADMAESRPGVLIIPTVLFTDRKRWWKDVDRELNYEFGGRSRKTSKKSPNCWIPESQYARIHL